MPGSYLLTKLNYSIVVPASGKLSSIYSKDLKVKHQPVIFWVTLTSNNMDHFFALLMLPNAEKDGSNEVYCSVI